MPHNTNINPNLPPQQDKQPTNIPTMDVEQQAFLYSQYRRLDQLSSKYEDDDSSSDNEQDQNECEEELLDSIINVSDNILKIVPTDASAIQCKTFALLENEEYEEVVECTQSFQNNSNSNHPNPVLFERAYALYKLNREREVLSELISHAEDLSFEMLQLKAQAYYKLGQYLSSANTYTEIFDMIAIEQKKEEDDREIDVDENDMMELCTNMAAAYVNANEPMLGLDVIDTKFPTTKEYELLFNRACALIACNSFGQARETLASAEVVARASMEKEGNTKEEIEQKCMVIQASRAVVDQLCGDEDNAKHIYNIVVSTLAKDKNPSVVAQNNLVSLRGGEHELFDSMKRIKALEKVSNLTARQSRLIGLNALSLRVLTGKLDEAKKSIQKTRDINQQQLKSSSSNVAGETKTTTNRRNSMSTTEITEEDMILIEAGILYRQKNMQECSNMLEIASKQNPTFQKLIVSRIHLLIKSKKYTEAALLLQQHSTLGSTPAGIATQVKLYELAGQNDQASQVLSDALQNVGSSDSSGTFIATLLSASAEMYMKSGDYQKAANTYSQIIERLTSTKTNTTNKETDAMVAARANLVVACSKFDPIRAAKEAEKLPSPSFNNILTPIELEESLAPQNSYKRSSISRNRKESDATAPMLSKTELQVKEDNQKKTQKAMLISRKNRILKRRAKRRKIFLAELKLRPDNLNKEELPKPNEERWVPKRLRRAKRRNRGRRGREKQMQGGHQGGVVSTDDLEKYDAKAKGDREKKEQMENGETKTKGKGKGKKKKGKKKGKRR